MRGTHYILDERGHSHRPHSGKKTGVMKDATSLIPSEVNVAVQLAVWPTHVATAMITAPGFAVFAVMR